MPDLKKKIIPDQHEGGKKDIEYKVTAITDTDARKLFLIARNRLLDVNNWDEVCGPLSAKFALTDQEGNILNRTAEIDDYFKISIPAPRTTEGDGYDWVYIEAIENKSDASGPYEIIAMRVRPAANPIKKGQNVSHFFNDAATSSFVVERNGKEISASIFGRNEVPNTETTNVIDKVRNAIVGVTALLGFADVQWKSLAKGLLDFETNL